MTENNEKDMSNMTEEEINTFLNQKIKRMRYNLRDDLLGNIKRFENNTIFFENEIINSKSLQKDIRISKEFIDNINNFIEILDERKKQLKDKIDTCKKMLHK